MEDGMPTNLEPEDDRRPAVEIHLADGCVTGRVEFTLRGDGNDWPEAMAGTFCLELYARLLSLARLHNDHGVQYPQPVILERPLITDEVVLAEYTPPPDPEQLAMPMVSVWERDKQAKRDLDERIEKAAQNGNLAPAKMPSRSVFEHQANAIYDILLKDGGELRPAQINARLPAGVGPLAGHAIKQRLDRLMAKGLVSYRRTVGFQNPTLYRATPREGGEKEGHSRSHPLKAVLPWSKGKTFLMLGGQPGLSNRRAKAMEFEATLQLHEFRWPFSDENMTRAEYQRHLDQGGIDLLILTRWNRTHSKDVAHLARERGIPVLYLKGCNVSRLVEQLEKELPTILLTEARRLELVAA